MGDDMSFEDAASATSKLPHPWLLSEVDYTSAIATYMSTDVCESDSQVTIRKLLEAVKCSVAECIKNAQRAKSAYAGLMEAKWATVERSIVSVVDKRIDSMDAEGTRITALEPNYLFGGSDVPDLALLDSSGRLYAIIENKVSADLHTGQYTGIGSTGSPLCGSSTCSKGSCQLCRYSLGVSKSKNLTPPAKYSWAQRPES